jgi:hypothetical protein
MHYLVPFRTSSFFYTVLSLAIIIILSEYDSSNNNIVISPQPLSHISHLIQVAAAVSTTTTNSNLYGKGGIIKIQLPGIIPDNTIITSNGKSIVVVDDELILFYKSHFL